MLINIRFPPSTVTEKNAPKNISWTDGRTDRGKTVYPPPPSGSRGIIKQNNSGVAPLRANNGIIHSDSNNKAEILNNQFKSAYTQEDTTKLPDLGESSIPSMPHITIKRERGPQNII